MLKNGYSLRVLTTNEGYRKLMQIVNDYLQYNYIVNNESELTDYNKFEEKNADVFHKQNNLVYVGIDKVEHNSYTDIAFTKAILFLYEKGIPYKFSKFDLDELQFTVRANSNSKTTMSNIMIGFNDEYTKRAMFICRSPKINVQEMEV